MAIEIRQKERRRIAATGSILLLAVMSACTAEPSRSTPSPGIASPITPIGKSIPRYEIYPLARGTELEFGRWHADRHDGCSGKKAR